MIRASAMARQESVVSAKWDAPICPPSAEGVRHKETHCTRAHQNRREQTARVIDKTAANRNGSKPGRDSDAAFWITLSGSNPYLPANSPKF